MLNTRAPVIDALRGLALFGILAVNIQSAVWSVGGPTLGVFDADSRFLDRLAVWLTAFFLEYKFYPIFCFCFGYGVAVQAAGWKRRGEDATQRLQKRLNFMLFMGIAHGLFIWFGDILARYALTAIILKRHILKGPRALLKVARFWLIITLAVTLVYSLTLLVPEGLDHRELLAMTAEAREVYESGTYWEVTMQRAQDFAAITFSFLFVFPQAMLLFVLGAVAARMGWISRPERHTAFLKRVLLMALAIGLPLNIVFTLDGMARTEDAALMYGFTTSVISSIVPIFSFVYIAGFALFSTTTFGGLLVRVLAPMGKLALTNYVLQSLVMSTLLYGYGFGLGETFRQAELMGTAAATFVVQCLLSHLYLRRFDQGPLESVWRRWTNR
jgi:uncharacterized protein